MRRKTTIHRIYVRQTAGDPARGRLHAGAVVVPCMLGPGGMTQDKREGDGATPCGSFVLATIWFRDRTRHAAMPGWPWQRIRRDDIWCDAKGHALYNRPSRLPLAASHERLWREDHVYDVILVLNHNSRPRRQGRGSAIFFHLARSPPAPTAGCVAISPAAMRRLLPRLAAGTTILITRQ